MSVRLVEIPSIVSSRGRRVRWVDPAGTVGRTVEAAAGAGPWAYILHGARVAADDPVSDGDEVVAVRVPAGPFIGIIFAVISAVISAGVGMLINLLLGPRGRVNQASSQEGSATYNWAGISNTLVNGSPVPVIYGEHRVGGQVIGLYRRNVDSTSIEQDLYMLVSPGFGPLTAIGQYVHDQDDLAPGGGGVDDGFDRPGGAENLTADSRYTLVSGTAAVFRVDDPAFAVNQLWFDGTAGTALVQTVNDRGLPYDNLSVQIDYLGNGDATTQVRVTINQADASNYHGFYLNTSTSTLNVIQRIAGVDTTLVSFSMPGNSGTVRLERRGDVLEVFLNGTSKGVAAPHASLTAAAFGFHGLTGGALQDFDNYKAGASGPLPDGMHINGIDANIYNGVRVHLRLGHHFQAKIGQDFDKVIQAYQPAIVLEPQWTEYAMHRDVEAFHVVLDFPTGLFDQSGGGGIANRSVVVEVEISQDGGAFTAITGSPFTFTQALVAPFSRTIFANGPYTGSEQRIRVRRRVAEANNNLIADRCVLADVNEVERTDRQDYSGYSVVAVIMRATKQLQGGTPTATFMVKGLPVPHWENASDPAEPELTYAYGQNPADVALEVLLSKDRGLGNFVSLQDVDVEASDAWRSWCAETLQYNDYLDEPVFVTDATEAIVAGSAVVVVTDSAAAANFDAGDYCRIAHEPVNVILEKTALGDGRFRFILYAAAIESYPAGWLFQQIDLEQPCSSPDPVITDTRHLFNGVFDGQISAWEALIRICRVGRAMPVKVGNQVSVRVEREGTPVQHISEANMRQGSLELTFIGSSERVDIVEAQYLDADQEYDQSVVIAGGVPPESVTREPIRQAIQLYGITSSRQARREASYHLLASRLLQERIKFALPLDGIAAEQGDIIAVGAVMPTWSHWTGRVTGDPSRFVVSHELVLNPGVTYVAIVRRPDNRVPAQVTITSPAGTYAPGAQITTNSADRQQIKDALCTVGTAASITRAWRIVKMTLQKDLTVEVEAVQYRPEVYALQAPPPCLCPRPPDSVYPANCTFFIPLDPECPPCETGCVDGGGCTCCRRCSCDVIVGGPGAACVIVESCGCGGIQFRTTTGCAGQAFTITVEVTINDYYNCDPNCTCEAVLAQVPPCDKLIAIFSCDYTCQISGTHA